MGNDLSKRGFYSRLELVNTHERLVGAEPSLARIRGDKMPAEQTIEQLRSRLVEIDRGR